MKDRKEAGISFEDRLSSLENYVVHASATLAKLNARYKRVRTSNSVLSRPNNRTLIWLSQDLDPNVIPTVISRRGVI